MKLHVTERSKSYDIHIKSKSSGLRVGRLTIAKAPIHLEYNRSESIRFYGRSKLICLHMSERDADRR